MKISALNILLLLFEYNVKRGTNKEERGSCFVLVVFLLLCYCLCSVSFGLLLWYFLVIFTLFWKFNAGFVIHSPLNL